MGTEKRKFKRFDAYMNVKYQVEDDANTKGISLSKDLCREGLKISSDRALSEGTKLDLEITIPDDPKPILTAGSVVWSRTAREEDQGFDQGVKLLNMDPVDKFRVLDYAYNHWLETKINDFSDPEEF